MNAKQHAIILLSFALLTGESAAPIPTPPSYTGGCAEKMQQFATFKAAMEARIAQGGTLCDTNIMTTNLEQGLVDLLDQCPMMEPTGQYKANVESALEKTKSDRSQICA